MLRGAPLAVIAQAPRGRRLAEKLGTLARIVLLVLVVRIAPIATLESARQLVEDEPHHDEEEATGDKRVQEELHHVAALPESQQQTDHVIDAGPIEGHEEAVET